MERKIITPAEAGLNSQPDERGLPAGFQARDVAERLAKALSLRCAPLGAFAENAEETSNPHIAYGQWQIETENISSPAFLPGETRVARAVVLSSPVIPGKEAETTQQSQALVAAGWYILAQQAISAGSSKQREPVMIWVISRTPDEVISTLMSGGLASLGLAAEFSGDTAIPAATRPLRICLMTMEIDDYPHRGGIGTAYGALARRLIAAGHEVFVLVTSDVFEPQSFGGLAKKLGDLGMEVEAIRPDKKKFTFHSCYYKSAVQNRKVRDLFVEREKQGRGFDLVHMAEAKACGVYAMQLKKLGLAFQETRFVVQTHGSAKWSTDINQQHLRSINEAMLIGFEKRAVALADLLISPSHYMLNWLREEGWNFDAPAFVQQNLVPLGSPAMEGTPADSRKEDIRELVFFGRLEFRKGLRYFCDALDKLSENTALARLQITFLGMDMPIRIDQTSTFSQPYIEKRAATGRWPWDISFQKELRTAEALEYLRQPGRLAVMPSLVDNSPYTVLECLSAQIPFLAARVGGIPELIHPEDMTSVTFPGYDPANKIAKPGELLARSLAERIAHPREVPARPAIDPETNAQCWMQWHEHLAKTESAGSAKTSGTPADSVEVAELPFFSVCIPTHNRADLLDQALKSLLAQDYPQSRFEVIVVDDGSTEPEAINYLERAQKLFDQRDWLILRQKQGFPGLARNFAAANAKGDYLLFMDDDNCADSRELSTFAKAIQAVDADVYTCGLKYFRSNNAPDEENIFGCHIPPGAAEHLVALDNVLSDTNAVWKASSFRGIGGFVVSNEGAYEDWEIIARAYTQGLQIVLVPDYLYYYRVNGQNSSRNTLLLDAMQAAGRPCKEALPVHLQDLLPTTLAFMQTIEHSQSTVSATGAGSDAEVAKRLQRLEKGMDNVRKQTKQTTSTLQHLEKRIRRQSLTHRIKDSWTKRFRQR